MDKYKKARKENFWLVRCSQLFYLILLDLGTH
jgi:hypothetical protein